MGKLALCTAFTTLIVCTIPGLAARGPAPCQPPPLHPELETRPGYMDFMPSSKLDPLKAALPKVADQRLQEILDASKTMWYDEDSMIFTYQDSIESVVGARANCVGRQVGERNRNHPQIGKLLRYFGPDYRFRFPFRTAAGTDDVDNITVINFWAPPSLDDEVLPVRYWQPRPRGRWYWVFPVGTVFGEVLYQKGPDEQWYVFEIRTRTRYLEGWAVDILRPFATAGELASVIERARPQPRSESLQQFISHLHDTNTLEPHTLRSEVYARVFPPMQGALDVLPDHDDPALITELLSTTTFKSVQGYIWKEIGNLETYGPSSAVDFSIVPKGYKMGIIPVNEVSCNSCHADTGRKLGEFEFDIQLYGEIWGEDRIFTWHLFRPHLLIFGTFDDQDGSRQVNPRMQQAGLVRQGRPTAEDPYYRPLPSAFRP